jgi:hypothetical protein
MRITYRFKVRARDADPDTNTSREEKDVSDRLLDLIDILYGLVIVEGALFYRPILAAHGHRNAPVVIALALIMYTVIRSFVDWHVLMESMPYQIMTEESRKVRWMCEPVKVRTLELWRLYMDFLIVATYSVMLLRAHVLLSDPAAGLRFLMWSFPALFLLYLVWGELFRRAAGGQQFNERLLLIVFGASTALAITYTVILDTEALAGHGTTRNVVALLAEALLMASYRFWNWKQQRTIDSPRPPLPGPIDKHGQPLRAARPISAV